jgi:glyoxylase-like metal-dependent hydrolase (beta-lactamase superfamily II)
MPEFSKKELQIGDYRALPVPTGIFGLDGGAMFGTVPKVLWEKSNPPDDQNRIPMEARGLLLKAKDRVVLIDTGNGGDFIEKYGDKLGPKFSSMYNVDSSGPSLMKSLSKHGISREAVTDVILTHLHFDHAGGATTARNGKLVPTFPKATYYVQSANLETARKPNIREKASYFPANFEPLLEAGCLKLLDGSVKNLLPGISVEVSNGHTQGQQVVLVESSDAALVYCGDVVPTSSHVRSAWIMGYDLNPLLLIEEKRALLQRAAEGQWHLFFEHDPYAEMAQIEESKGDFAVTSRSHLI